MSRRDEVRRRVVRRAEPGIGDAELRLLTGDLDALHRDTFPAALEELRDTTGGRRADQGAARLPTSRRGVLLGGLAAAGAGLLAACGSGSDSSGSQHAAGATPPGKASPYTGDLRVVALAVALENLAVAAYTTALAKARAGDYGTVPAAVGEFATVARTQHSDHAKAWNGVLSSANLPTISGTPLTIAASEVAKLKATKSVPELAAFALNLENTAAHTYLYAMTNVTGSGGITTAATIAPVEAMHAAILSFIAGDYPVPDSFIDTSSAVGPAALTA
ncbi:ferritin-like domain-containing protein [Frankia sp. R82]|uniref:ferritin-like domain-containing protein n=1 Tax=Frankia sp. R82 TaxID=2950553 RepID=UPI0020434688|nr:ferritin-like domain-containing protein [Frankia sp. R82]MCM3883401.1 ferritin-like domain-containing protein [Frankia sp. R82]